MLVKASVVHGINHTYKIGETHPAIVTLDLNGLSPEEVGVEIVITEKIEDKDTFVEKHEFVVESNEGNVCTYKLDLTIMNPGNYNYGIRVFPKNPLLPHRFDFKYLHWI